MPTVRKPRKKTVQQKIVERFLSHKIGQVPQNFWPREIKAAKSLLLLKPEEFWLECAPPGDKINSLNWFLTEWGRRYVNEQAQKINDNEAKRLIIESRNKEKESSPEAVTIPVEDFKVVKKPKTLMDFLS